MALTDKLTAIANAIRTKTGGTNSLTLDQMASEISNIQSSGANEPYIEEVYDSNGNLIDVNMHGFTKIRTNAFYGCSRLALTSLPSGLTSIGYRAFSSCTGLTSITFEGTPTSISSKAFSNCTNLTTINVPWSEGAVADAPWGATKATINYNYTGA